MSRIGIIYCAYQTADLVTASLAPWIAARREKLAGHEYVIVAVSVPFVGFEVADHDDTRLQLYAYLQNGEIDHLIAHDEPMKETDARGAALKWLVEQGVTHIWQHDSDEFPTIDEIAAICAFIEARPHIDWFRLSLKNQVFTPFQYLVEPFTPARIHKVHNAGGYVAAGFHQDNNVYYERPWNGERILDTQMTSVTVPKNVAWIAHRSWMNDLRSKAKVSYQTKRWGAQSCTFAWDDSKGGLIFNPALPPPEIARD